MPELPEVEVVRRGVEKHCLGRVLTGVDILDTRSVRGGLHHLIGRRISAVVRRGKYLWLVLDPAQPGGAADGTQPGAAPKVVVAHLKMSGQLLVDDRAFDTRVYPVRRHEKVHLHFDDDTRLTFVDQRVFGYLGSDRLIDTGSTRPAGCGSDLPLIPASVAHIGRDLLDPHLDVAAVVRRWQRARRPIKTVLLDQHIASGVGNIYADEALFEAGVDPRRRASALSRAQLGEILTAAQRVMRQAMAAGGTSFDSLYVNTEGESGYFERALNAYGRAGQPCRTCGHEMGRIKVGGRSSHTCPACQPYGRGRK